ncbi:hypothetical protein EG329_001245 [Mollisiaceae sp. DMI_Dod_QoI]|nr:hypothetical protein EG329_001245 [Helotiales sp. DMI_Dod_QoI]
MPPKRVNSKTPTSSIPSTPNASTSRSPAPNKPEKSRKAQTKWTKQDIDALVAQLKEAKASGNTSENGFKSTVWTFIANRTLVVIDKDEEEELKRETKAVKRYRESITSLNNKMIKLFSAGVIEKISEGILVVANVMK